METRFSSGPNRSGKSGGFGDPSWKACFLPAWRATFQRNGFLQIALSGLLRIAGNNAPPFKLKKVRLAHEMSGDVTWTQFFQADLERRRGELWAVPIRMKSRLQCQARAQALIRIPEGVECLAPGNLIEVQVLF